MTTTLHSYPLRPEKDPWYQAPLPSDDHQEHEEVFHIWSPGVLLNIWMGKNFVTLKPTLKPQPRCWMTKMCEGDSELQTISPPQGALSHRQICTYVHCTSWSFSIRILSTKIPVNHIFQPTSTSWSYSWTWLNFINRVKPFICTMPMRLDDGWNQIQVTSHIKNFETLNEVLKCREYVPKWKLIFSSQFNLADFTRRAYGTNYVETLRVRLRVLSVSILYYLSLSQSYTPVSVMYYLLKLKPQMQTNLTTGADSCQLPDKKSILFWQVVLSSTIITAFVMM